MREFHWMSLLTGLRRNDLATLKWCDVSVLGYFMTLRAPKGGTKRSFKSPLSPTIVRCLARARIAGRVLYDRQSREWVFPRPPGQGMWKKLRARRGSRVRKVTGGK